MVHIRAVLYHKIGDEKRPVCFVSRTLSPAERNYNQTEKEALAVFYVIHQFHYYLRGQSNFTLVTDHKPLLDLFPPTKQIPPLASGHVQRRALILQCYIFTLIHRSGTLLGTADALSRLPLQSGTHYTSMPTEWTSNKFCSGGRDEDRPYSVTRL